MAGAGVVAGFTTGFGIGAGLALGAATGCFCGVFTGALARGTLAGAAFGVGAWGFDCGLATTERLAMVPGLVFIVSLPGFPEWDGLSLSLVIRHTAP